MSGKINHDNLLISKIVHTQDLSHVEAAGLTRDWFLDVHGKGAWDTIQRHRSETGKVPGVEAYRADRPRADLPDPEPYEWDYLIAVLRAHYQCRVFEDNLQNAVEIWDSDDFDKRNPEHVKRLLGPLQGIIDNYEATAPRSNSACAEDVPDHDMNDWIVPAFLRDNTPTLWSGRAGSGKSTVMSMFIAKLTTGVWGPKYRVMYCQSEENISMIKTRVKVGGADLSRVHLYQDSEGVPTVPALNTRMQRAAFLRDMQRRGVDLVVIDTLDQALPGVNPNSDTEVGQILRSMTAEFMKAGITIWGQRHSKKGDADNVTAKVNGAEAWVSSFRQLVTVVMNDEVDPPEQVITSSRNVEPESLLLRSDVHDGGTIRDALGHERQITWYTCDIEQTGYHKTANQVEAERAAAFRANAKPAKEEDLADTWLESFLATPRKISEVVSEGDHFGLSKRTWQRRIDALCGNRGYDASTKSWCYEPAF
jgi:hypothetical protein